MIQEADLLPMNGRQHFSDKMDHFRAPLRGGRNRAFCVVNSLLAVPRVASVIERSFDLFYTAIGSKFEGSVVVGSMAWALNGTHESFKVPQSISWCS